MAIFRQKNRMVGIEIRPQGICMVMLSEGREKSFCVNYAQKEWRADFQRVREKYPDWAELRSLLADMVQVGGLRGMPATVLMPATEVKMSYMRMPGSAACDEVETTIQATLRQSVWALDTVCVDFKETGQQVGEQKNVYYVAAKQSSLADYVDCAVTAGLDVKVVDIDIFAVLRVLSGAVPVAGGAFHLMMVERFGDYECAACHDKHILFYEKANRQEVMIDHFLEKTLKKVKAIYPFYREFSLSSYVRHSDHLLLKQVAAAHEMPYQKLGAYQSLDLTSSGSFHLVNNKADFLAAAGAAMREGMAWK